MNFKKLKSESGRSMVEMLGVLAIIGVLSVGGIAGYSLSMRRHRANGVIDLVSKYALVAYNQCQQKVLNGEIFGVDYCTGNSGTGSLPTTFDNAGVGTLPAGVTHIGGMQIATDTATGVDTVVVSARFDDDKLCQAVASSVGKNCNSGSIPIAIKQN
jgi:type II secretory pathway pseudopilin PulG